MPAFQHCRYCVVQLAMVHFSDLKPLITNFIAFTCFRLEVQRIPPKQGNAKIYELQYDLPYHFIKKNMYTPLSPNYVQNNLLKDAHNKTNLLH